MAFLQHVDCKTSDSGPFETLYLQFSHDQSMDGPELLDNVSIHNSGLTSAYFYQYQSNFGILLDFSISLIVYCSMITFYK